MAMGKVFWAAMAIMLVCPAAVRADAPWRLTRYYGEHLENHEPVTLDALRGHQALLAFWRIDCPPCRHELDTLPHIAQSHPDLPVRLVVMQDNREVQPYLFDHAKGLAVWVASGRMGDIFKSFDAPRTALPLSVFLKADGSVCDRHYGIIGSEQVDTWIKTC
jgi:thiol-disulfide isomerase/thioredoxin